MTELLRKQKKATSTVEDNPMPHLVQQFPECFAASVVMIFSEVNKTSRWPLKWKREHLTIIPKVPNPADLSEYRNISCTPYPSKVLKNVLLEKLRQELAPDSSQYGGIKGCGAKHMVVDIWDKVLEAMDKGDKVACLLGVDFKKAFNRMDHSHCLQQLRGV